MHNIKNKGIKKKVHTKVSQSTENINLVIYEKAV